MKHLAVCLQRNGGLVAFVISAPTWTKAERFAESFRNREGYVGWESFQEAVDCCMRMERREGWIYPTVEQKHYSLSRSLIRS